jgi:hypothetical protein
MKKKETNKFIAKSTDKKSVDLGTVKTGKFGRTISKPASIKGIKGK